MNKLKIVWQNVWVFVKKRWLLCAGSFGFIVLVILFLPIFRSSWLLYPESLRARIAIRKLSSSNETAFYCREDCAAERLVYKNIITSALKSDNLNPDLETAITSEKILPEIRRVFIEIWQSSGQEPSEKINQYYLDPKKNFLVRAELARAWPQLANSSFNAEIIGQYRAAKTDEEKITMLNLLYGRSDPSTLSVIWGLILNDASDELKSKAWFLLSNIENKAEVFALGDLEKIRTVLESGEYPHRLKDQAILILADYYPLYPEASGALLKDVVNRPIYFDDYQRTFAIDILNRNSQPKLASPQLSQADWDEYFNN